MSNAIKTVEKYFELSNQGDLAEISKMFSDDSTYDSSKVGMHHGSEQIMEMMTKFYAEFSKLKWIVNSVKETQSGTIEVDFTFNGLTREGIVVVNTGIECFVVRNDKLQSVKVRSK